MIKRPVVAIVGRPNVGKSTLFNKLIGKRRAIVEDFPGVTRDWNTAPCAYRGRAFTLVDTGGLLPGADQSLAAAVHRQSEQAIEAADIILFVMDGREGLTPVDQTIQDRLRKCGKPVYHVINKTEGRGRERIAEFYVLGVERLYPVSSEHNIGLSDLLDALHPRLTPPQEGEEAAFDGPRVVLLGRPNVGKSTLINAILKEERLLTSDIPGTTRDTVDTFAVHAGKRYLFIDTAGIRRRGKIAWGVEQFSVSRSKRALERAEIALLLVDGSEGITEQDTKLAGMVLEAGRGLILLINKSDLIKADEAALARVERQLNRAFSFISDLQFLYLSALKAKGLSHLFRKIDTVHAGFHARVPTGDLNRFFEKVTARHPPPNRQGRPVRLFYITQAAAAPPVFVLFANDPKGVDEGYRRYLQNRLHAEFGFQGTPIRIKVRARKKVVLAPKPLSRPVKGRAPARSRTARPS